MKKKQGENDFKGIWTDKFKAELLSLDGIMPPEAIAKKFKITMKEFYTVRKILKNEQNFSKVIKYENGIKITIYAPAYAMGITPQQGARNKNWI